MSTTTQPPALEPGGIDHPRAQAPATEDWELVPYSVTWRNQLLALMRQVNDRPAEPEDFAWWFERNPAGRRNIMLAVQRNRVIGAACHSTFTIRHQGKEALASVPLNLMTHPEHRGRGVFTTLEAAAEENARRSGIPFLLCFPNAMSRPILVYRLGWREARTNALRVRPVSCDKLAERVPLLRPIAPLLGLANGLFRSRSSLQQLGLSAHPVRRFGEWADRLYEQCKPALPNCLARGSDYLNWRYLSAPGHRYRAWRLFRGPRTVGYAVTGTTTKKHLRIGYLASSLVTPDLLHYMHLIEDILTDRIPGVDLILAWTSSWLRNQGARLPLTFLPTPTRLLFVHKGGAQRLDFSGKRDWFFQLGDLDFF